MNAPFFLILLFLFSGCSADEGFIRKPSMLSPQGPMAANSSTLIWVFLILGLLVFVGVMVYLGYALFHNRRPDFEEELAHPDRGIKTVLGWGAGFTGVVLIALFAYSIDTMAKNESYSGEDLTIDVIGHQWWWEVRYPDEGFESANVIHIPVDRTVTIRLSTDDVIHSLWIPELNGKLDTIPGKTNVFTLRADRPGEFWGECAEYCGTQHAKMKFLVIAEPVEDFQQWVEAQQAVTSPDLEGTELFEGQQIFLGSACVYCHTIRGTNASGDLGPDLTHFATRRTIGSGILENTPGNLAGWVVNSQHIKPGNKMPPMDLTGPELQALLAYLNSLE